MGYQAEKNRIEKRIKRIKDILLCVLLVALLGLCVFSAFVPPDSWKYHVGKPSLPRRKAGELRIHFIDVGQGDCTLVELPDGKVALIDGGDSQEGTEMKILRHLNALRIDVIDYVIATHSDADHCGGLQEVVAQKKVLNAYLPTTKPEKACAEYVALYAELMQEGCAISYSERYLSLGNSTSENGYIFTFLYPYASELNTGEETKNSNLESAVMWLDYHGVSALFAGDAPRLVEQYLMRDDKLGLFTSTGVRLTDTEILKVAHHGSADASTYEFLKYLQVETAVISCGKNNTYGHPATEVKENLTSVGASIYRTDQQGSIVITITSDGRYSVANY
ncbi:MAG: MBL fold metallo-hydrolase [Clostridia bacterium]|nr:MBL fold metallo-hydrolase [Clostridia bacterium]